MKASTPRTAAEVAVGRRAGARAAPAQAGRLNCLATNRRPLDWNGPTGRTFSPFRAEDMDRSIIDHFERVARRQPDRVAVTDGATSLTYGELWDGLSGLAEAIAAETAPGDLVAIRLPVSPLVPLAMLACLAAGRPFVALDPHYPGDWSAQVLADARPALIIAAQEGGADSLPTAHVIRLTVPPPAARPGWRPAELGLDDPACVLFTSGSTGRPKGIVNSQRNLLQRVAQSINAAHVNTDDRFLTLASLCTIVGVRDVMTALIAGAGVRLLDPQGVGAREILEIVRAQAVTILFAFPALLRSVVSSTAERAGEALRLVRVGGDTTLWGDIDLLRAWLAPQAAVQLVYAATEAPMMQWFVDDAFRGDDPRIPIGYPLPGNRLAIVDEDGRSTPPGAVGELIVTSPYVALGYWTDGRCDPDGFAGGGQSAQRVFRTGDLVRQRPDGLLDRLGRRDRQVKIRGARVDLDGVEAALRQHLFVRDVGVLARTLGADGATSLVAYVSARDGAPAGLTQDLRALMARTPAPMRPARFYRVPEIPRLPGSKLDVRALTALDEANVERERASAAAGDNAVPAAGDGLARTVAQVWRDVLQTPVCGPDDDFFDVGGDSLQAITFMIELERALERELPLSLIHEAPRFAELCETLRANEPAGGPLVVLKAGEGLPPVFIVHGVGGTVADLFAIARRMTYAGPVIGIQARGLGGRETPHPTVEAMAAAYLAEVKARQPQGPYYLCGYSFGGLVAFEMARRLRQSGEEVGLLGLFDTMASPVGWVATAHRAWIRAAEWLRGRLGPKAARAPRVPGFLTSAPAGVLKVAASALLAGARYRPGFYPGELTLFIPRGRDPRLPSPAATWAGHATGLSIVETAGDHLSMLAAPHADTAAAALTRCLPGA